MRLRRRRASRPRSPTSTRTTWQAGQIKVYYADDAADPVTAGNVCNRLVNSTHVSAILGFESTPSTAACNTYLTSNNMPYILAQTSTSGSLCLSNYFSLANVGNQQVNPLIKYLTKNGTKKIYIVASDFSSGHVGAAAVTAQAAGSTGRRSSAPPTSRSARPTSRATSRRSPPRSRTRSSTSSSAATRRRSTSSSRPIRARTGSRPRAS